MDKMVHSSGPPTPSRSATRERLIRGLRLLVVVGAPIALAVLELWHPLFASGAEADLLPVADRWLAVHLLQLPLFALLALSLHLLVDGLRGAPASIARVGAIVFASLYAALDAVAGIATGVLARASVDLDPAARSAVVTAIDDLFADPIVGGGASVLTIAASLAWLIAALAAAMALRGAGAHRVAVVLVALAAVLFPLGHTPPNAQLALGCFAAGAALAELGPRSTRPS
jgi:hypothetical protein